MTTDTTLDHRAAIADTVDGLVQLLLFLDDRPTLTDAGHLLDTEWRVHCTDRDTFAACVRELTAWAPMGAVVKRVVGGFMTVERAFGSSAVVVQSDRDTVCEWVATGTETVQVPDPDAPTVTVERPVGEWRCSPILVTP